VNVGSANTNFDGYLIFFSVFSAFGILVIALIINNIRIKSNYVIIITKF